MSCEDEEINVLDEFGSVYQHQHQEDNYSSCEDEEINVLDEFGWEYQQQEDNYLSCEDEEINVLDEFGNENQHQEDNYSNLLSLPNEIIVKILSYLDSNSLKKLRLVCRRTKFWVEQPYHIKNFQIYIRTQKRMNDVIRSNIEWSNFHIILYRNTSQGEILPFLKRFRFTMKIFKVVFNGAHHNDFLTLILLNMGVQLESLHVVLSIHYSEPYNRDDWKLCEDLVPKESLAFLKYLNLEFDFVQEGSILSTYFYTRFFPFFFENCPNLISINFPILCQRWIRYTSQNDGHEDLTCTSLIEFVKRKQAVHDIQQTNLKIDFSSAGVTKLIKPIFLFPLTTTILLKLVSLCQPIGCVLWNVPSNSLPTHHQDALELTDFERSCLNTCVKSVLCVNEMVLDLKYKSIPSNAPISVAVNIGYGDNNLPFDFSSLDLPSSSLNIRTIRFFYSKFEEDLLCFQLLRVIRPSVKELDVDITNFPTLGLKRLFPNLQKLTQKESVWTPRGTYIQFRHDKELEDLTLENVYIHFPNLLRVNHPSLVIFQNLVHFRVIDNVLGNSFSPPALTNYTFLHLFSHMRLKTFVYKSLYKRNNVTFDGICTLASIQDGFKDTIENFECFIPSDSTRERMKEFLRTQFKNLKCFSLYTISEAQVHQRHPNYPIIDSEEAS